MPHSAALAAWPVRLFPDRLRGWLVGGFFGLLLALGGWLVPDYGTFGDESSGIESGHISLAYVYEFVPPAWLPARAAARLAATPPEFRLPNFIDRDYGVAFELPMAVVTKLSGYTDTGDIYRLRHLCIFLVCFAGIGAFYWLAAQRLASWRAGLLGALLLVLSPRQFADFFYNAKDAVFLAAMLLATATAVAFVQRPSWKRAAWHALACAFAIDVRIMGIMLPPLTFGLVALRAGHGDYPWRRVLAPTLGYGALTVLLTIAFWPYLWVAPFTHLRETVANMSHFRWDYVILHQGHVIPTVAQLPRTYALVWLGITIPLLYLAGLLVSAGLLVRQLLRRGVRLFKTDAEWQDLLFWALGLSPIAAVIGLHSVIYDGWRQLYFVYPPLLLLALRGLVAAWHWRPASRALGATWPVGVSVVIAAALLQLAAQMVRLHPFENLYFNPLAGSHPELRYEYDYWGLSMRQGLRWIVQHDRRPHIRVSSNLPVADKLNRALLTPAEQARLIIVRGSGPVEYFITTYRFHAQPYPYGAPVYTLRADYEGRRVFDIFRLR